MNEQVASRSHTDREQHSHSKLGNLLRNSIANSDAEAKSSYKQRVAHPDDESHYTTEPRGTLDDRYRNVPPTPDPRTILRSKPFSFTKPSRDEKRYYRTRCTARTLFAIYLVVVAVLLWHFHSSEAEQEQGDIGRIVMYCCLVLVVNLLLLFPLGSLAI